MAQGGGRSGSLRAPFLDELIAAPFFPNGVAEVGDHRELFAHLVGNPCRSGERSRSGFRVLGVLLVQEGTVRQGLRDVPDAAKERGEVFPLLLPRRAEVLGCIPVLGQGDQRVEVCLKGNNGRLGRLELFLVLLG